MDALDKQSKITKPSPRSMTIKPFIRYCLYGLGVIIAIVAFIFLTHKTQHNTKANRSKKLISTIQKIEKSGQPCSYGLKQVGSVGSKLSGADLYDTTARETGLDYIMACTFEAGNTKQALIYAGLLDNLYVHDGIKSYPKHIELTRFINYMKSYRK